ncbi:esterase OVCA2-like, partial [Uloborus diversus]|uniref:esterase OVCA2-like n=1 Tax=Uloborus diversus TaxID=327109 RepID=UPI00240A8945
MSNRKLKILCLHGYRQNAKSFREKTGGFRKSIKNVADLVYIDAPHEIPLEDKSDNDEETSLDSNTGRAWWFATEDFKFNAKTPTEIAQGFDESVACIKKAFETEGPFDGIFGFSQGAAMASLICGLKEIKEFSYDFHFAIIVAGFKSVSLCHQVLYENIVNVSSLHIMGKDDTCIPKELSEELASRFHEPQIVYHEDGHYVPTGKNVRSEYMQFLRNSL